MADIYLEIVYSGLVVWYVVQTFRAVVQRAEKNRRNTITFLRILRYTGNTGTTTCRGNIHIFEYNVLLAATLAMYGAIKTRIRHKTQ